MPPVKLQKKYLTELGLQRLRKEHQYLVESARAEVAKRIKTAREDGEVEENIEFKLALEERNLLETRIAELEDVLRNVEVVEKRQTGRVQIGNTVVVSVSGEKNELTLVGCEEADPSLGSISYESPVGRALLGCRVGDSVEVAATVKTVYKILAIK